jgi:hypothetical protein
MKTFQDLHKMQSTFQPLPPASNQDIRKDNYEMDKALARYLLHFIIELNF